MNTRQFKNYSQDFKGLQALFVAEQMRLSEIYYTIETHGGKGAFLADFLRVANAPRIKRILERLGAVEGERVHFSTLGALCKAYASTQRALSFCGVDIYKDTLRCLSKWCAWCTSWGAYFRTLSILSKYPYGKMIKDFGKSEESARAFFSPLGLDTPQQLERLENTFWGLARIPKTNIDWKTLIEKKRGLRALVLLCHAKNFTRWEQ